MPRYIDADDLKAVINANDWSNPVVPDVVGIIIDRTPTADVVPKSEVDELAEEYSDLIVEKDQLFDEVVRLRKALDEYEETSGLKQAKVEVAREIFEEIEKAISELDNGSREAKAKDDRENFKTFCKGRISMCDEVYYLLSELKKKYTEGET